MRIGSLFSGYGGLDLAVMAALDGEVAWHSEVNPYPARVLAARFPDVPNLGDVTAVDWSVVDPVDVLTAGFPCQPASTAGKRKGMSDERWLWDEVARAVAGVRPGLVLLENVPGLLSVDGGRAFERVVCDLAALGFVGRWGVVRAADAGAPHGRARVFVVAYAEGDSWRVGNGDCDVAADAAAGGWRRPEGQQCGLGAAERLAEAASHSDDQRHERQRDSWGRRRGPENHGQPSPDANIAGPQGSEPAGGRDLPARGTPADAQGDGRDEGRSESARLLRGPDAAERDHAAADAAGARCTGREIARGGSDNESARLWSQEPQRDSGARVEWGVYEPAIRRWERVLGRPAPSPTEPGRNGPRLNPRFVEWMQGLPDGWVTDILPRNPALKALGNGVCPQQAALALRLLLVDVSMVAA